MYVCMYVCKYVCMYVCMYVYIYIYIYTYRCVSLPTASTSARAASTRRRFACSPGAKLETLKMTKYNIARSHNN